MTETEEDYMVRPGELLSKYNSLRNKNQPVSTIKENS